MSVRIIAKVGGKKGTVYVYRNTDWDEFHVVATWNTKADYFTDDKSDAIATARLMANEGEEVAAIA